MIEKDLTSKQLKERLAKVKEYSEIIPFIKLPLGISMRAIPTLDGIVAVEFSNSDEQLVMTLRERNNNPPVWKFSNGEMCLMGDVSAIDWMLNDVFNDVSI